MHATRDPDDASLTLNHNGDWSGEIVIVVTERGDTNDRHMRWRHASAADFAMGRVADPQWVRGDIPIPLPVFVRAVSLAAREYTRHGIAARIDAALDR